MAAIVTMKQIAEICGVSRGTVDRAINGRGKINPDTEAEIIRVARQLGYEPNPAGKALAARKTRPIINVVLSSEGNAFFDEVIRGMKEAADSYRVYGIEINFHTMKGYNIQTQCGIIDEIRDQSNAVIINPIDAPEISQRLDDMMNAGVFVVAVNNDLTIRNRHCYVGSNYFNGGRTACALIEAILGENAKVGIVLGSKKIMGHRQRLEGFRDRMKQLPMFKILDVIENEDDEIFSYERTCTMLENNPDIDAVFIIAGGVYGAGRAISRLQENQRPLVIAFDSVPSTVQMMQQGIIKAILYQHPYRQGHLAVDLAFEYLVNGRHPDKSEYILNNEIRLLENLTSHSENES